MLVLQEQTINRPASGEYAPYYGKYIALAPEEDIVAALRAQLDREFAFLRSVLETQADVLHPPYTWTIKQVIGHLSDGERIFAYRALRIGRGDATPLPGFDENEYARTAGYDQLTLRDLVSEFESVRRSTVTLFENLPESAWSRRGEANGNPVSVRALAFIIAGHTRHHLAIVRKRLESGGVSMEAAQPRRGQ